MWRARSGPAPPWPAGGEEIDPEDAYARLAEAGYEYGPAFQGLRAAWRSGDAILAELKLPDAADAGRFGLQVYYGDGTRLDVLRAAAASAEQRGAPAAAIAWMHSDSDESPVVSAS